MKLQELSDFQGNSYKFYDVTSTGFYPHVVDLAKGHVLALRNIFQKAKGSLSSILVQDWLVLDGSAFENVQ